MKIVLISEDENKQLNFIKNCAFPTQMKDIDTTIDSYSIDIDISGKIIQLCVVKWYNQDTETLARIYLQDTRAIILLDRQETTDYSWVRKITLLPQEDFFFYSVSSTVNPYDYLHDVYAAKILRVQTRPSCFNRLFKTASMLEFDSASTAQAQSMSDNNKAIVANTRK